MSVVLKQELWLLLVWQLIFYREMNTTSPQSAYKSSSKKSFFNDIALAFGTSARESLEQFGAITLFFFRSIWSIPASMVKYHLIIEQMLRIGVNSLFIVFLTSTFIGGVTVWQEKYLVGDYFPRTYVGMALGKALFTDLGPVLTALVLTGRIGAKLATELGCMKVTEQIDAMICLSLDPYPYLLTPRILTGFLMTPFLMVFSFFFSILSAQIIAWVALGIAPQAFYNSMRLMFQAHDVVIGLVKAFVFGGGITLTGCYYGFLAHGGAVGVGQSTKNAVVAAATLILFSNVIINLIFM
jgi:phospholipid/cholesterol/gamma-HCH transport system permease protein